MKIKSKQNRGLHRQAQQQLILILLTIQPSFGTAPACSSWIPMSLYKDPYNSTYHYFLSISPTLSRFIFETMKHHMQYFDHDMIVSNNAAPLVTQLNTVQYQLIIDLRCYFSHNIKHNILGPQWHTHWFKFGPNNPPLYTLWPPLPTQNSHPIKLMRLPISSLCWWSDYDLLP